MADWYIKVTVPSGTVGADLVNFPLYVDLSNFPEDFWTNVASDGSDIRAYDSNLDRIPVDLVSIVPGTPNKGVLFVKVPSILATGGAFFYIIGGGTNPEDFGKDKVWSDYEIVVIPYDDDTDRTGKHGAGTKTGSTPTGEATGTNPQLSGGGSLSTANSYIDWFGVTDIALFNGDVTLSSSFNGSGTYLSYRDESSGGTNDRIVFNSGGSVSTWSDLDSWLTGPSRSSNTWYRSSAVYDTTNDFRYLLVNGSRHSDSGSIGNYAGSGYDTFTLGREDESNSERFNGQIGWSYLRGQILSQEWLTAEYDMLSDNATFLTAEVTPEITPNPDPDPDPDPVPEAKVTQVPILTVDTSIQEAHVSQVPLLLVVQQAQPTRVTQLPVLAVIRQREVPFPKSIVPEVPLTETWSYLTVVTQTHRGLEQRSALRENPRFVMEFDALILDDSDREAVYSMLYRLIDEEFLYPAYQHSVTLTAKASAGSTSLSFNAAKTDVRSGETLAVFNPRLSRTYYVGVDEVSDTGATLTEGLPVDVPASWLVCPAYLCRFPVNLGLSMDSVSGKTSLMLESVRSRPLERVSGASLLTKYDNKVVLDKVQLSGANEDFDKNMDWLDTGTSIPQAMTDYRATYISGNRVYSFETIKDIPYWRAFAEHCKGRQNTFLIPTFRDDLPLFIPATPGTKEFVTSNLYAQEMIVHGPYDYGLVETVSGRFYCKIDDAILNYDSSGNPESLTVKISETITAAIVKVSFVYTARLDSDNIKVEYGNVDSVITLPIRTVIR